jgi:hypothetical protein
MKTHNTLSIVAASVLASASLAWAHGVQVQVTYDAQANKVVTREVVRTSAPNVSTVTDVTRIYVMPILPTLITPAGGSPATFFYTRPEDERSASTNRPLFPSGPGITWQYDVVDPTVGSPVTQIAGTGWSLRNSTTNANLGGSNFRYRLQDVLRVWDGAGWADPGTESLQLLNGDGTNLATQTVRLTATGTTGAGGTWDHAAINGNPATLPSAANRPHTSATFRLADNGNHLDAGDSGIYLAALSIETTALSPTGAPINPTDTFYYVMAFGASIVDAIPVAERLAAAANIPLSQVQVVPEPATLSLIAGISALVLRRHR